MKHTRLPLFTTVLLVLSCVLFITCSKKTNTPSPNTKTVLTGYYSIVGLYSINDNGTYTAEQLTSCLANFSLDLQANNQMQLQDACLNLTGTWTYANNIFTLIEANGSVAIKGAVTFEADGITIDINNTIDNTRYQLYRN